MSKSKKTSAEKLAEVERTIANLMQIPEAREELRKGALALMPSVVRSLRQIATNPKARQMDREDAAALLIRAAEEHPDLFENDPSTQH